MGRGNMFQHRDSDSENIVFDCPRPHLSPHNLSLAFSRKTHTLKWFFMEGLLANDDVESTSNLRQIYVKSMSNPNLHRIYVEFTSNLRRVHVETCFLATEKPCGASFWGHKKPLREWGHALPRFSAQKQSF